MAKISFCFVACLLFAGCATARPIERSVVEHQRNVERVAASNRDLARLVEDAEKRLDNIGREAAGIADTIDRLAFLFAEYEREIDRILREIGEAGRVAGKKGKGAGGFMDAPHFVDNRESVDYLFED